MIIFMKDRKGFLWLPVLTIALSLTILGFFLYTLWIDRSHLVRDSLLTIILTVVFLLRILWLIRWFRRDGDKLHCHSIFGNRLLNAKTCAMESSSWSFFSFLISSRVTPFPFLLFAERTTGASAFIGYSVLSPVPKYMLLRIESVTGITPGKMV